MIINLVILEVSVLSDLISIFSSSCDCHPFLPPDVCSTTQAVIQVGSDFKNYRNVYLTGSLWTSEEFFHYSQTPGKLSFSSTVEPDESKEGRGSEGNGREDTSQRLCAPKGPMWAQSCLIWLSPTFVGPNPVQSDRVCSSWDPDLSIRRVLWIPGSQTLTRHHSIPWRSS